MGFFLRWIPLVVFLTGCSGSYLGKDLFGAEEFVRDSYRIREGKFSILEMEGEDPPELDEQLLREYADTLDEDDVLTITLFHPKRKDLIEAVQMVGQTVGYRVSNGELLLPDLQPIPVKGMTLDGARRAIQGKYREQIADVEIFVTYKNRMVRKVELAGLVHVPSIPVDGKIRLFDALSRAAVPPNANLFKSYMIRDGEMLSVDLHKLLKQGDMTQNVVLRGGDKIYIAEPSAATLMVMGEVGVECVLDLPNGYMPLRQALAAARGVPYTGDKSYIQVIRGNIAQPKIYTLNWEHVIHLPNNSLLLMPGDIVYVAPTPITEWNRFISQLLPSFTTIDVISGKAGLFVD